MFQLRKIPLNFQQNLEESDRQIEEFDRQIEIYNTLLLNAKLDTGIKYVAIAIYNAHPDIDIRNAKRIEKLLDKLEELLKHKNLNDICNDKTLQDNIKKKLIELNVKNVVIQKKDIFELKIKPIEFEECMLKSKLAKLNLLPLSKSYKLSINLEVTKNENLQDFEKLIFNSNVFYHFYPHMSFALYLFNNALYNLNVKTFSEINNYDDNFFTKLCYLINECNYDESIVKSFFFQNDIYINEIYYDVSFIPKYNINNITPLSRNLPITYLNTKDYINYWNNLDLTKTKIIKYEFIKLFKIFPLKQSYYIYPDGKTVFLNVKKYSTDEKYISHLISLCTVNKIENYIYDILNFLTVDDLFSYAAHINDLKKQGYALFLLRIICGPVYIFENIQIPLPTIMDVLEWVDCTFYDDSKDLKILLPKSNINCTNNPQYIRCVSLIKYIVQNAGSKFNACLLCSRFSIPEAFFTSLYTEFRDKNNEMTYVILTIISQQYNNKLFYLKRENLKVNFTIKPKMEEDDDNDIINIEDYEKEFKAFPKAYYNKKINETIPYIAPLNMYKVLNTFCVDANNFEKYEFSNARLQKLVKVGLDIKLTSAELGRLIYLLVKDDVFIKKSKI